MRSLYRIGIITASDKGSRGERVDESGKVIEEIMKAHGYALEERLVVEDDKERLKDAMKQLCDDKKVALLLTTGGTGFSPRDVTPEATMEVATRMVPGISEAIRAYSMSITKRAMLSRGVSVLRNETLIVNLPGSPKAVRESLEYIVSELKHGLDILNRKDGECARK